MRGWWWLSAGVFFCALVADCTLLFVTPSSYESWGFVVLVVLSTVETTGSLCLALDAINVNGRKLFCAGRVLSLALALAVTAAAVTHRSLALIVLLLVSCNIHTLWTMCVWVGELRARADVQPPTDFCPPTEIPSRSESVV